MKRSSMFLLAIVALTWPVSGAWSVPPTPDLSGPGATGSGRGLVSVGDDDNPEITHMIPRDSMQRRGAESAVADPRETTDHRTMIATQTIPTHRWGFMWRLLGFVFQKADGRQS